MIEDYRKPAKIGAVELRNRVIMGSMHTGLEEEKDLTSLAEFYRARAEGAVGLIITGGVSPNQAGALFAGGAMMVSEADVQKHQIIPKTVHEAGGKIFLQLLHAGRYAVNPDLVAPSAIKAPINPLTPREMTALDIEATIEAFAQSAQLAQQAGYDGVEIMGSEGYLINQFLVTHTNQREDEWGGDYANRMRFPLEIIRHMRARVGADFGIIFRISLLDLIPNGSTEAEIQTLAKALESSGADALNSGFGWHEARVPTIAASVPPTPFLDLTARLKSWVSIPVIAANRFFEPAQIETAIQSGQADFVAMARPFLADADFMKKCDRPEEIAPCIACNQACLDKIFQLKHASCLVNPRACRETQMPVLPAEKPKDIAVVGGGPAGLSAAIVLSERGHKVTLFESAEELGGQLKLAAKIPGKNDFNRLLSYYKTMIERRQITLRMERAEPETLTKFDSIIIATGVTPRIPDVDGITTAVPYDQLINEGTDAGTVVVIGSGPIGFDVASFLVEPENETQAHWRESWGITRPAEAAGGLTKAKNARSKRDVTMLQRSTTRFGKSLGKTTGWIHRARLEKAGVKMMGGVEYNAIDQGEVKITTEEGATALPSELVAICAGQESVRELYDTCCAQGLDVHIIGGAKDAHKIDAERAIFEAYELALTL